MIGKHDVQKLPETAFLTFYANKIEKVLADTEKSYEASDIDDYEDDFCWGAAVGRDSTILEIYRELLKIIKERLNYLNPIEE